MKIDIVNGNLLDQDVDVIVNAWKEIWEMSSKQLGGHRSYKADFEIYDERAADHQNIVLDLYIGITP